MFIQSAEPGQPHRAITMYDHAALSGQFARYFGNAAFEQPVPIDLVAYVIAHHDAGWTDFDRDPATDEATGLPYTVFQTPAVHILPTSKASPDFNEKHHAYCGLLSSMHTYGIYMGRYGFTTAGRLARISDADKPAVEAMLANEVTRQERLKAQLASSSETSSWIEHDRLFQAYKLLQFCDLLAIYFNTVHPAARSTQLFTNVPTAPGQDTDITLTPSREATYGLTPFPFSVSGIDFAFPYRDISQWQSGTGARWSRILREAPLRWETVRLVAG